MLNWLKDLFAKEAEKIEFVESDLSLQQMIEMIEIPEKNYSIGKYPVTQSLWESIFETNPSNFRGNSRPVEFVNWFDCIVFCNKLSEQHELEPVYVLPDGLEQALQQQVAEKDPAVDGSVDEIVQNLDANGYRLPTDWEWYFAAKANQQVQFAGSDNAQEVAWTHENSKQQTQGVGQLAANAFGIHDMSGNVWEWCWNRWEGGWQDIPTEGAVGPSTGSDQVIRGGSWLDDDRIARVAARGRTSPSSRTSYQGFRLCRSSQ